jgi:hypothetical protein
LLNLLNVLGLLIDLEPAQAKLLETICAGPMISAQDLIDAGAFEVPVNAKKAGKAAKQSGPDLFGNSD